MFIVTSAYPISRSFRSESRPQNTCQGVRCAPTELEEQKKDRQAIALSPLWGEAMGRVYFEVEFAKVKSGCERTNPRFGCLLFAACCLPTEDLSSQPIRHQTR